MKHWSKENEQLLIKLMNQQKSLIGDNTSQAIRNIADEFPDKTFNSLMSKWGRIQRKLNNAAQTVVKLKEITLPEEPVGLTETIEEEKKARKVSEVAIVAGTMLLIIIGFFVIKLIMG